MLRVILQQLALFLLPIAVYVAYALWARRRAHRLGVEAADLRSGPWFWLIIGGLALSIVGFVVLASVGYGPDSHYVPPHIENGRIVPGQLR